MARRPVSASQRVRDSLRQQILRAELRPGELILESTLARENGVSKTPAREALQMLAAERLVTVIPHRGYYVSTVNFHDFREAMELRLILEPALVALAAKRSSRGLTDELRGHLDQEFGPGSTLDERLEAATAFHLACVTASGNSLAMSVVSTLFTAVQRLHYLHRDVEDHIYSDAERDAHEAILSAIMNGQADEAQRRMYEHLVEANKAMAQSFLLSGS